MSSSSGRRSSPPALPVASTSGQKRARGEDDPGTSLSNPDSAAAPAQNPRRAFSSSPFADFGSYMSAKNSKLTAQFDADAATSAAAPGALFAGVSIFVDGFTVPSSQVPAAGSYCTPVTSHSLVSIPVVIMPKKNQSCCLGTDRS
jgi:DNA repair protein REV1